MAKIKLRKTITFNDAFESFLLSKKSEGLSNVTLPSYKAEDTIKETYTDRELELLLKKPNLKQCSFPEYRDCITHIP